MNTQSISRDSAGSFVAYTNNTNKQVRTQNATYARILKAAQEHDKRLAEMVAKTAAFLGADDGDIIFA